MNNKEIKIGKHQYAYDELLDHWADNSFAEKLTLDDILLIKSEMKKLHKLQEVLNENRDIIF